MQLSEARVDSMKTLDAMPSPAGATVSVFGGGVSHVKKQLHLEISNDV